MFRQPETCRFPKKRDLTIFPRFLLVLVRLVQQRVDGSLDGIAIFSGTPPMVTEQILYSDRFEGELLDPILNRKITLGYTIHTLDWFKGT